MAVPKKKTSKSRRDKRRSHEALGLLKLAVEGGSCRLPHNLDLASGKYKGEQIVALREPKEG